MVEVPETVPPHALIGNPVATKPESVLFKSSVNATLVALPPRENASIVNFPMAS